MKIITMDLDSIVLFLSDMDFSLEKDTNELEDCFREVFLHLKNTYQIDIQGYYRIDIYKDNYYGIIVEIEKEEFDYFDYMDNQVDMRISIHDDSILYEFDDLFCISPLILQKLDIYIYGSKIYGKVKEEITVIQGAYLLEHSISVVYGDITEFILQKRNNIVIN